MIKGRDTTAGLPTAWKAAVTALVGDGLGLALVGLWLALAAQAGTRPLEVTLAEIHRDHVSVDHFRVTLAVRAARKLTLARRTVALALVLPFAGTALTWWAPDTAPPSGRTPAVTGPASPAPGNQRFPG
ncbi:hypothetical protein QQY24_04150 [Streptomyces sp. TG1A-8]|uniref:hypothetical protein n=1 Tax=Streptomyces sp. TG1A-8 TaxID=3051385 RepID=UPI00265C8B6E|nr:hypothetical protein [Streptomyces sp. TG1A-8]MDO0924647.1 hypothetical protein [Streptomyces sp. TG1A-8]